jgi:hypothetical protein
LQGHRVLSAFGLGCSQKAPETINYGLYFHPNVSAGQELELTEQAPSEEEETMNNSSLNLRTLFLISRPAATPRLRMNGRSFKVAWVAEIKTSGPAACPIALRS